MLRVDRPSWRGAAIYPDGLKERGPAALRVLRRAHTIAQFVYLKMVSVNFRKMVNHWLCVSAIAILAPAHFWAVIHFRHAPMVLRVLYIVGPLTSVWNHGSTSHIARWADRIAMAVGCIIDCCFIMPLHPAYAALCYFIAKKTSSNWVHTLSHVLVSVAHVFGLMSNVSV